MKNRYVKILATVLCLVLLVAAFVACTDDDVEDADNIKGSWTAAGKIWAGAGKVKLTFAADGTWVLNVSGVPGEGDWLTGTNLFDGAPRESALRMTAGESPNCFISGAASGEEVTIEPENGIYEIVFDLPSAKGTKLKLIPPGTLPEE